MRNFSSFILSIIILISVTPNLRSQGIVNPGQILSKTQANQLFGTPVESFSFNKKALLNILTKTPDFVMFGYKNGKFLITNAKRKLLYPENITVASDDVLNTFGTQVMAEFIEQVSSTKVLIELRPGAILTISSDDDGDSDGSTLEYSVPCPPLCPW